MKSVLMQAVILAVALTGFAELATAQNDPVRPPPNGGRLPINNEPYVKVPITPRPGTTDSGGSISVPKSMPILPSSKPGIGSVPGKPGAPGEVPTSLSPVPKPTYGPPAPIAPVKPPPRLGSLEVPMPQTTRPTVAAPSIQPRPPSGASTTPRPPPAAGSGRAMPSSPSTNGPAQRGGGGGGYGNRTK